MARANVMSGCSKCRDGGISTWIGPVFPRLSITISAGKQ
jgi:hypothetical protein